MEPMLGQIVLFGGNFVPKVPPRSWAFCAGQVMMIQRDNALYSLLGTTFGGDGRINFKLPDLQSQVIRSPDAPPAPDKFPQGPYIIALVGNYPQA